MSDFIIGESGKTSDDAGVPVSEKNLFVTDMGGALRGDTLSTLKDVEDATSAAQTLANTAKITADAAELKADAAQSTADAAESKADAAQSTADTAQARAESSMLRESRDEGSNPPSSAITIDFQYTDSFTLSGRTGDVELTPINVPTGQSVKLTVEKTSGAKITWVGVSGTVDGKVTGSTSVKFELVNFQGNILAVQTNRQYSENLGIADFAVSQNLNSGTIESVTLARWDINDNIATFNIEISVDLSLLTAENFLSLVMSGLSHNMLDGECVVSSYKSAAITSAIMTNGGDGTLAIWVQSTEIFLNNQAITLYFSGSYRIE